MAHSIQEFRGKYEIFNDFDLTYLIRILLAELHENRDQYPKLNHIKEACENSLMHYSPGCIGIMTESLEEDQTATEQMLKALASSAQRLEKLGETISADFINKNWAVKGSRHLAPYNANRIQDALNRLTLLLSSS